MVGGSGKRLRQGKTLLTMVKYLIRSHPKGMKRSEIQDKLQEDLGVGASTGGVNRHLKKLRRKELIEWDQDTYTYTLPSGCDSIGYFNRIVEAFDMSTDQAYFMSLEFKKIASPETMMAVDDCLGFRYDDEMSENLRALHSEYRDNEVHVHDLIKELLSHHNNYVRLRLFKTSNECFVKDLLEADVKKTQALAKSYSRNLKSIEESLKAEADHIFTLREELVQALKENNLSKRMKFLIRFSLSRVRPSLVYDRLI